VAPAGIPSQVLDKLWSSVNAAMHEPAVRDILVKAGSELVVSKPDEFRQVIESDYVKYGKMADLFKPK
jgi:tripartite-type tricarboxylate transporter receptor subunit TctC